MLSDTFLIHENRTFSPDIVRVTIDRFQSYMFYQRIVWDPTVPTPASFRTIRLTIQNQAYYALFVNFTLADMGVSESFEWIEITTPSVCKGDCCNPK